MVAEPLWTHQRAALHSGQLVTMSSFDSVVTCVNFTSYSRMSLVQFGCFVACVVSMSLVDSIRIF